MHGIECRKKQEGIYTLHGISFLDVQVIITEEIDSRLFKWLSALTDRLTEERAKEVVASVYNLTGNEEKRLAEAVMQVLISANGPVFSKIKEGIDMTLMEFMKPEADAP